MEVVLGCKDFEDSRAARTLLVTSNTPWGGSMEEGGVARATPQPSATKQYVNRNRKLFLSLTLEILYLKVFRFETEE
ncbi:hypothetical protein HanRHA438_Chr13g0618841 [Helianthus annuus]|nr:hypothetical protein HanIR_Chr12g0567861 [Helianthus annuus]KAJ0859993.1 hypothetical protein HanRHA438_Chr13g0618841 [Helianthus annuus]